MVGTSAVKWIVGAVVLLLLVAIPANCVDWNATQRAADAAARAQVAVARALDAEAQAAELRAARDNAKTVADGLAKENERLRGRLSAAQRAVPPREAPVEGCEACEARMTALESVIGEYETLTTSLTAETTSLRVSLTHSQAEAALLGRTVGQLREELAVRTAVKPVLKARGIPLPALTFGYAGVIVSRDSKLAVVHGPGASLGYKIPLPRLF